MVLLPNKSSLKWLDSKCNASTLCFLCFFRGGRGLTLLLFGSSSSTRRLVDWLRISNCALFTSLLIPLHPSLKDLKKATLLWLPSTRLALKLPHYLMTWDRSFNFLILFSRYLTVKNSIATNNLLSGVQNLWRNKWEIFRGNITILSFSIRHLDRLLSPSHLILSGVVYDFQIDGGEDFCYSTKSEAPTGTGKRLPDWSTCYLLNLHKRITYIVYSGDAEERIKQEAVRWSFLGVDVVGGSARLRDWLHIEPDVNAMGLASSSF